MGERVETGPEDETMATFIRDLKRAREDYRTTGDADPIPLYMAASEQKQKSKGGGGDDDGSEKGEGGQKLAEKGDELKEEMDVGLLPWRMSTSISE